MRYFLTIAILIWFIPGVSAQTYYYEKVAEVRNGAKTAASGDGHFITFTDKGCYDSDNKGFTENNGFLEYKRTANGIRNYYGDSWFGRAYYYFSTDLGRLNVKIESSGNIYVYARKSAPAGVTKSSRRKESPIIVAPPVPMPAAPVAPTFDSPSGSSGKSSAKSRYGYYTCPSCCGTGKCPICHGSGLADSYYTGGKMVCPSCTNGRCSSCNGTGKKYGVIH